MPIATKTGATLITQEFQNQIEQNLRSPEETNRTETVEAKIETIKTSTAEKETKKGKYSDVVNLHFTTGKRAEFKAFFSSNEITLVQGVELAVNYIMKEVKAGNLTISRNGIEKVGE